MSTVNCNCSGFNPDCVKCGGRGYYEAVEETTAQSFKIQLKEVYSSYPTVRFQHIKEILLLDDSDENNNFFNDGLQFYKIEKNNILKIAKHAEYISSQHLFVSICEDYFGNVGKVMQLVVEKEELDEANRLKLLEAEKAKSVQNSYPNYPSYVLSKSKREKQKRLNEKKEVLIQRKKYKLEQKNSKKKKNDEVKKKGKASSTSISFKVNTKDDSFAIKLKEALLVGKLKQYLNFNKNK